MEQNERDRLRYERELLKDQFSNLFYRVQEILFQHDPIGINFETNTDEYDPEVGTILPRLKEASSESDVRRIVHEEFRRWFGIDAGDIDRYREAASEIWSAWQRFQTEIASDKAD